MEGEQRDESSERAGLRLSARSARDEVHGGGRPTPENAHTPTLEEPNTRFHRRYLEDAIAIYKNFKFVIAYEHEVVPGYITEKLTNAFLAAAVPIYIGAGDVTRFFNPNAMVICSKEDVRSCIAQVIALMTDEEKYITMLG